MAGQVRGVRGIAGLADLLVRREVLLVVRQRLAPGGGVDDDCFLVDRAPVRLGGVVHDVHPVVRGEGRDARMGGGGDRVLRPHNRRALRGGGARCRESRGHEGVDVLLGGRGVHASPRHLLEGESGRDGARGQVPGHRVQADDGERHAPEGQGGRARRGAQQRPRDDRAAEQDRTLQRGLAAESPEPHEAGVAPHAVTQVGDPPVLGDGQAHARPREDHPRGRERQPHAPHADAVAQPGQVEEVRLQQRPPDARADGDAHGHEGVVPVGRGDQPRQGEARAHRVGLAGPDAGEQPEHGRQRQRGQQLAGPVGAERGRRQHQAAGGPDQRTAAQRGRGRLVLHGGQLYMTGAPGPVTAVVRRGPAPARRADGAAPGAAAPTRRGPVAASARRTVAPAPTRPAPPGFRPGRRPGTIGG